LDSDCGYNGGINYWPDSDSDKGWSEDWTSDSNSEEGSLVEFDEDDLVEFNEDNLEGLEAELKDLCTPLPYDQITEIKSKADWKKVEKNQEMGYTGTSQRTQQRKEKGARDRAAFHDKAKTTCVKNIY
jgi:hypothetical protein